MTCLPGDGWQAALAYVGQSGDGYQQSAYGRSDLVISRTFVADRNRWRATLGLQRLDSPQTTYSIGSQEPLQSRYSNRFAAYARLSLTMP